MSPIDINDELRELREIARVVGSHTSANLMDIVDRLEATMLEANKKSDEPVGDQSPWGKFNAALRDLQKSHRENCPGGAIHLGTILINDGDAEKAYQKRRAARAKRKKR